MSPSLHKQQPNVIHNISDHEEHAMSDEQLQQQAQQEQQPENENNNVEVINYRVNNRDQVDAPAQISLEQRRPQRPYIEYETSEEWTQSPDFGIELPDFNTTIDRRYCWRGSCSQAVGDYNLFVPVSESMPLMPILVRFHSSDFRSIEHCQSLVTNECPSEHGDEKPVKQPNDSVVKVDENLFEIPVGMFVRSRHQFRVGYSSDVCDADTAQDMGKTFEQFSLIFYRVCDQ